TRTSVRRRPRGLSAPEARTRSERGPGGATSTASRLFTANPVRAANADRNGGLSGADRSSGGNTERTQPGETGAEITWCAVKANTPIERGSGGSTTVTPPSAGGG